MRSRNEINQSSINQYYFIVSEKVDQRAGQLSLPYIGITTESERYSNQHEISLEFHHTEVWHTPCQLLFQIAFN